MAHHQNNETDHSRVSRSGGRLPISRSETPASIPTFVLGPLAVRGKCANGQYHPPLATTEASLPAGLNRGNKLLNAVGGPTVRILKDAMSRCPVLECQTLEKAAHVPSLVREQWTRLQGIAAEESRHCRLVDANTWVMGRLAFVRFCFETDDAMGMNIATIAADRLARDLARECGGAVLSVSSNLCCDKKAAAINGLLGRGKTVTAEVEIPEDQVRKILRVEVEAFCKLVHVKHFVGSSIAGANGYNNAHCANIVAGVFAATGQDLAQIVESSMAITYAESTKAGLYMSLLMPSLEVGTVGGGTGLPYAQRHLAMMDCTPDVAGDGASSRRLAEIIVAGCMAGELSLLACLAENKLGSVTKSLRCIAE